MITTKHSVFFHLPKTAGTWVRHVLQDITETHEEHKCRIDSKDRDKFKFAFVRNPWAFYVSMYNYMLHGSQDLGKDPAFDSKNPFVFELMGGKPGVYPSFEEFVCTATRPSAQIKANLLQTPKGYFLNDLGLLWQEHAVSFYQLLILAYTSDCDYVGRSELAADELAHMLTISGELTAHMAQAIASTPRIKQGIADTYSPYYTQELKMLVADDMSAFIKQYGYEF